MRPASAPATPKRTAVPWATVLPMGRAGRGDWVKFGAKDYPDWPAVTANLLSDPKDTK